MTIKKPSKIPDKETFALVLALTQVLPEVINKQGGKDAKKVKS